jgi:hypothetical protein
MVMPTDWKVARSARWRQETLARWENEGGALDADGDAEFSGVFGEDELLPLADAELMQLRIRVIALENLIVALLAKAPEEQLRVARERAGYIAPRPGFTPHKLTIHAENQMLGLVERAVRFRTGNSPAQAIR